MTSAFRTTDTSIPARIGVRYAVSALLGRGGMAQVYRALDESSMREVALKQLLLPADPLTRAELAALFEREFHTLAQLSHPRVIEVYDYGVDTRGPYYTMELLDGGDLRERSPMPWREACALLFDVCSSLALLHSRRLIHRDVSPRNVRCTRDGRAKLIDFGAMAPVGPCAQIVGTPPFVAPEVVHRANLDARTDLFSLGGTLYYALTRRMPYPVREFVELGEAWRVKPAPPSALAAGVPRELDALCASLLSIEPALRPRSAFDVMQRLAAIADLAHDEPLSVAQAYLSTPVMVGRERMFTVLRRRMARALHGRGRAVLIEGAPGLGRSRMLDAYMLEAKTLGATVLRANAGAGANTGFAVAQALGEQLLQALPEPAIASARAHGVSELLLRRGPGPATAPRKPGDAGAPALDAQIALRDFVLRVAREHPIAIAVDDVHRIDEPSAALLAALADKAYGHKLLLALASESEGENTSASRAALSVLRSCCVRWKLAPLDRAQIEELFSSVFGDVPNIGLLSHGIHAVAAGNPRAAMDLAQHLVDRGVIRYEQGGWTLPHRLDPAELPSSAEHAIRARIGTLGPHARAIAQLHALALHDGFSRPDYALLRPDAPRDAIDDALTHLLAHGVLTSEGGLYTLAHRGWAGALIAEASAEERRARHGELALFHRHTASLQTVHHLLEAEEREPALDLLAQLIEGMRDQQALAAAAQTEPAQLAPMFERALQAAIALGRKPREQHELRRWLCSLSIVSQVSYFRAAAPAWLAQLAADSGLAFYREQDPTLDANTRLMSALTRAQQRWNGTPESERVYAADEAIRHLVQYVAVAVAIGSWTLDGKLLRSLPELLTPFAPLSLAVDSVLQTSYATIETLCDLQPERARERWTNVFERLRTLTPAELPYVELIRNAVAYGVGTLEARIGLPTAPRWVEFLDADVLQRVNGLYLRRIMQLQQGDWNEAERFRRQAEVAGLQAQSRQIFNIAPLLELAAHSFAGNLGGLKQTAARIEVYAQQHAGWAPYRELAEALFQRQRGDLEAACAACARALALAQPEARDPQRHLLAWPTSVASYLEILIALGRAAEAREHGNRALEICSERGIHLAALDIVRALALVEAKLGDYASAITRLEALIAEHTALGLTGLHLGASYEARARIAIWAGDEANFAHFAALAAREYRHGEGSPLGVRYERLVEEARRAGMHALPDSREAQSETLQRSAERARTELAITLETKAMREATSATQRAQRALKLLCSSHGARGGYLFLFREQGLARVASHGERELPDGLREYLIEYLAQDHDDAASTTAIVADPTQTVVARGAHWTSPGGRVYCPIVLACVVDGVERYAGMAALVLGQERDVKPGQAKVAASVGSLLIEAGDTTGLRIDQCIAARRS